MKYDETVYSVTGKRFKNILERKRLSYRGFLSLKFTTKSDMRFTSEYPIFYSFQHQSSSTLSISFFTEVTSSSLRIIVHKRRVFLV